MAIHLMLCVILINYWYIGDNILLCICLRLWNYLGIAMAGWCVTGVSSVRVNQMVKGVTMCNYV